MDTWINLFKIVDLLNDGAKTIEELIELSSLDLTEIKNIFKTIYKFQLNTYLNLQIYSGDEEVYFLDNIKDDEFKKLEVLAWWHLDIIDRINDFNTEQQWILFKLFKDCNDDFINDIGKVFLKAYSNEFEKDYNLIESKTIIKKDIGIFNLPKNILIELYNSIVNKQCINVILKSKRVIYDISPIKIHFNDDSKSWYLQYGKKKQNRILRIDKIAYLEKSNYMYKEIKPKKFNWGWNKKSQNIKIRIYNERNAKEVALRFLSRKDIIYMKNYKDYIEYLIRVSDVNLFMRWARSMLPKLVILEPIYLKQRMKKEILQWESMYKD